MSLPLLGVLIGVLSGFGGTAIVLKSQALSVTVKPFVDAARVAGWFQRPHHLPAHHPQRLASQLSLHDVHGHRGHLARGDAVRSSA